jgi:DNA mismatch repair ATPase MutS
MSESTNAWQFLREKPWGPFLAELDSKMSQPVALYCLGGFVLKAVYDIPRFTGDLDYIEALPKEAAAELEELAGQNSTLAKQHKVFVHFTGVTDLPFNYESRLRELDLALSKLRLFVPEVYDLALSKLSRNSPKDRQDVQFLAKSVPLVFDALQKRFDEEMDWIANRERHQLTLDLWKEFF